MNYFTERSLYYYFLMREISESADMQAWRFVARQFGVKAKEIKYYEKTLKNETLEELSTCKNIEVHKNYLRGFCGDGGEFGCSETEAEVLEMKLNALIKTEELFGNTRVKGMRQRSLSHKYERDHAAAVLYALNLIFVNKGGDCRQLSESILRKELAESRNSDAGIALLRIVQEGREEIMDGLAVTPDMLLRPIELKSLSRQFGGGDVRVKCRRTIGF